MEKPATRAVEVLELEAELHAAQVQLQIDQNKASILADSVKNLQDRLKRSKETQETLRQAAAKEHEQRAAQDTIVAQLRAELAAAKQSESALRHQLTVSQQQQQAEKTRHSTQVHKLREELRKEREEHLLLKQTPLPAPLPPPQPVAAPPVAAVVRTSSSSSAAAAAAAAAAEREYERERTALVMRNNEVASLLMESEQKLASSARALASVREKNARQLGLLEGRLASLQAETERVQRHNVMYIKANKELDGTVRTQQQKIDVDRRDLSALREELQQSKKTLQEHLEHVGKLEAQSMEWQSQHQIASARLDDSTAYGEELERKHVQLLRHISKLARTDRERELLSAFAVSGAPKNQADQATSFFLTPLKTGDKENQEPSLLFSPAATPAVVSNHQQQEFIDQLGLLRKAIKQQGVQIVQLTSLAKEQPTKKELVEELDALHDAIDSVMTGTEDVKKVESKPRRPAPRAIPLSVGMSSSGHATSVSRSNDNNSLAHSRRNSSLREPIPISIIQQHHVPRSRHGSLTTSITAVARDIIIKKDHDDEDDEDMDELARWERGSVDIEEDAPPPALTHPEDDEDSYEEDDSDEENRFRVVVETSQRRSNRTPTARSVQEEEDEEQDEEQEEEEEEEEQEDETEEKEGEQGEQAPVRISLASISQQLGRLDENIRFMQQEMQQRKQRELEEEEERSRTPPAPSKRPEAVAQAPVPVAAHVASVDTEATASFRAKSLENDESILEMLRDVQELVSSSIQSFTTSHSHLSQSTASFQEQIKQMMSQVTTATHYDVSNAPNGDNGRQVSPLIHQLKEMQSRMTALLSAQSDSRESHHDEATRAEYHTSESKEREHVTIIERMATPHPFSNMWMLSVYTLAAALMFTLMAVTWPQPDEPEYYTT